MMKPDIPPPREILVEEEARAYPSTLRILSYFGDTPVFTLTERDRKIHPVDAIQISKHPSTRSAPGYNLHLRVKRGNYLKTLPFYEKSRDYDEYYLAHVEGCIYDCAYCYLRGYLESPRNVVIYVNPDPLFEELSTLLDDRKDDDRPVYLYTGHLSDSLLWHPLSSLTGELIEWVRRRRGTNIRIELRSKCDTVDALLRIPPDERIVCAWTLNPPQIARKYEKLAPSPDSRLEAMAKVARHGFGIGLRFDPVFHYRGWEADYRELVQAVQYNLDRRHVHSITLGCFRFSPSWRPPIEANDPATDLFTEELAMTSRGKMSYIRPIRRTIYRVMSSRLRAWAPDSPVYLSMEDPVLYAETGILPSIYSRPSSAFSRDSS